MTFDVLALDVLTIAQTINLNIKSLAITQFLSFQERLVINIYEQQIHQSLLFVQLATVNKTIAVAANNALVFAQTDYPRIDINATSSFLFMWHEALSDHGPHIQQQLIIAQNADVQISKLAQDILMITQSAIVHFTKNVTIPQTLILFSNGTQFQDNVCKTAFGIPDRGVIP